MNDFANPARLSKLSKRNVIPFPARTEETVIFELGDDVAVYVEDDQDEPPPKEAA